MLRLTFTAIACIFIFACGQRDAGSTAVEDTIQRVTGKDSALVEPIEPGSIDYALIGFYQGQMPCDTCDGSQQTLLLKEDGTFMLHDLPRHGNAQPLTQQGVWSLTEGNIILFVDNAVAGKFNVRADTLFTTQRQGVVLSDSASRHLALFRKHYANQHPPYKKRMSEQALKLYAIGTEPFWNLSIDSAQARFKILDWKEEKSFLYQNNSSEAGTVRLVARNKNASDSLTVLLTRQFCSDGMSDILFEYRVEVMYKSATYNGCGIADGSLYTSFQP